MYWFFILKEVDGHYSNDLEQDVFIADNREEAKAYLKEKFGKDIPFRKPKNAPNGTKYLYLTDSNEYWYNRLHKEVNYICSYCNKETTVVGKKNIIRNYSGEYCSLECKEASEKKEQEE